jgi:hypothetical protein
MYCFVSFAVSDFWGSLLYHAAAADLYVGDFWHVSYLIYGPIVA